MQLNIPGPEGKDINEEQYGKISILVMLREQNGTSIAYTITITRNNFTIDITLSIY